MAGLTCCNALSERFEILVTRYGKRHKIGFREGELIEPLNEKTVKDKERHGSTFMLIPSKRYMGSPCTINSEEIYNWLSKIIHLVNSDITINFAVRKKGKESLIAKKFKNKDGLADYIKVLCPKPSGEPIHIISTRRLTQETYDGSIERFMGLETAFVYDPNSVELVTDSFCNFINTVDNGTHVDAVRLAIVQYFAKAARESLTDRESKKYDIQTSDILQGLVLTVYLSTDYPPMFTGQTKEKVGSPDIIKPIKEMMLAALKDYFTNNPKDAKKIIDRIKINAKARTESTKVRQNIIKARNNNIEDHMRENFAPANNRGNAYKELIIIEGRHICFR